MTAHKKKNLNKCDLGSWYSPNIMIGGMLFEQPIWLTTYMITIIYKEKVDICMETKVI